ncbi:hypothetical protein ABPG72_022580 [Tetrahymena utriculariae]
MQQPQIYLSKNNTEKFLNSACNDPNADPNYDCYCKAGYYGSSSDKTAGVGCIKCQTNTTTVQAKQTISACQLCIDPNAQFDNNASPPTCFCKAGFYGDYMDKCIICPGGTTSDYFSFAQPISKCYKCLDNNAYNNNNYSIPACICKAGFQGSAQYANSCVKCPDGITCNQCIDVNAYYNFNSSSPACFCNAGYYGSADDAKCIKCPSGTTSGKSASITNISACNQCIDPNAYNTGGDFPVCLCNKGYYGTAINAYNTQICTKCPSSVTSGQATSSNNIAACTQETNAGQQAGEIDQGKNIKDNDNKSYLISIILISVFFIFIVIIFTIWIAKQIRSTVQNLKDFQELIKKNLEEILKNIKTNQLEKQNLRQIINTGQPVQINQNENQILQKNDFQDKEEQPLSQQTIYMIKNYDDMQNKQNSDQDFKQVLALEIQESL